MFFVFKFIFFLNSNRNPYNGFLNKREIYTGICKNRFILKADIENDHVENLLKLELFGC